MLNNIFRANKGEWSEFYALLKLLSDQRLYAADANLEILDKIFYPVLKVITAKDTEKQMEYKLSENSDEISIVNPRTNSTKIIDRSLLKSRVKAIFDEIKAAHEATFTVAVAEELLEKLECYKVQAASNRKADIFLVIHDIMTGTEPEVGFSIKSQVGSASTLLNAGATTNFIFEVENFQGNMEDINAIDSPSKIRDRVHAILESGGKFRFISTQNSVFLANLRKIDSLMPETVAEMLLMYYQDKGKNISSIVKSMEKDNPLRTPYFTPDSGYYEYKIKNLLMSSALGMMPGSPWDGLLEAHGGFIIVRNDGEIVCYHIYNLDQFREYLFKNTRLETGSSTRHDFGSLYRNAETGKYHIKLNLQIRFTS